MQVRQLLPTLRTLEVEELLEEICDPALRPSSRPFDPLVLEFCAKLSANLLAHPHARSRPEVIALAYWMRRSQLNLLQQRFQSWTEESVRWVPRGLVFHLPPSNVDTIFVYTWLLAALAGNRSLVRLSSRSSPTIELLLEVLGELLLHSEYAGLRGLICCIGYGHEREITAAISARCDLRVVWGGDQTVTALRQIPLPPLARELVFPDRFSYTVIGADEYLAADEHTKSKLAEDFWNDAYWFDQMACSSPRLIIWRGGARKSERASKEFFERLHQEVLARGRGRELEPGVALDKINLAYRAILDQPVSAVHHWGDKILLLSLSRLTDIRNDWVGGGVFYQKFCQDLRDILEFADRRDQTVSYFGLGRNEMENLVDGLNGRGIDRIVPVGQALKFHWYWDGQDLLREMLRLVHLPGLSRVVA